jgi:Ankyrin repeat
MDVYHLAAGDTLLHLAVRGGDAEIVQCLLGLGDWSLTLNKEQKHPLLHALQREGCTLEDDVVDLMKLHLAKLVVSTVTTCPQGIFLDH